MSWGGDSIFRPGALLKCMFFSTSQTMSLSIAKNITYDITDKRPGEDVTCTVG